MAYIYLVACPWTTRPIPPLGPQCSILIPLAQAIGQHGCSHHPIWQPLLWSVLHVVANIGTDGCLYNPIWQPLLWSVLHVVANIGTDRWMRWSGDQQGATQCCQAFLLSIYVDIFCTWRQLFQFWKKSIRIARWGGCTGGQGEQIPSVAGLTRFRFCPVCFVLTPATLKNVHFRSKQGIWVLSLLTPWGVKANRHIHETKTEAQFVLRGQIWILRSTAPQNTNCLGSENPLDALKYYRLLCTWWEDSSSSETCLILCSESRPSWPCCPKQKRKKRPARLIPTRTESELKCSETQQDWFMLGFLLKEPNSIPPNHNPNVLLDPQIWRTLDSSPHALELLWLQQDWSMFDLVLRGDPPFLPSMSIHQLLWV